jgi:hypothetical protein
MVSTNSNVIPSPPSLMKSLMAGFDAVGNHVSVILFSVGLDIFLWFGPRLRLEKLLQPVLNQTVLMPELQNPETITALQAVAKEINFFSLLRTFPVGIPSLIASRPIFKLPIGNQISWDLTSYPSVFVTWLLLMIVGLLFGSLYFTVVAQAAILGKVDLHQALKGWLWTGTQVLLLTGFCLVICLILMAPFSCVFSILLMSGLSIEQLSLISILVAGGILVWLIIPIFFSPHGIFINKRSVWNSLIDSIQLARITYASTGLLLLVLLVISEGLNMLWNVPPPDSWLVLVGIVGHAFISASLLAASFVYYRDALLWIKNIMQKVNLSVA